MPDSLFGVLYQCWPQPDGSLRLEFLSEGAERLLEATADEVLKGLVDGTFPLVGVDREKFYADFAESVTRHSSWKAEFGYVGPKSGVVRWFRAQDFPRRTAEGAAYFSGVLIDITELKRAEERAREAYSELEAHLANTPLAVVEWDREARIRRWSGQAEAMFGWRADEVLGRTVCELNFVHEGDLARLQPVVAELLEQRVPGNVCRNRNRHKSGLVVDCLWHNSAHLDRDGKIVSVLALGQDMTEQAAVEGELTLSEERLRTSLRFAGMLSWDIDIRRMSMYYSQDVREFFGVPDLPEGADLEFGMAHPDDRARVLAEAAAASLTHRDFRLQYRGVRPDPSGQTRWFSTRGSFVATSDGELARCMGVTADITERRREELDRAALDGELREARHLESLGRMAGGIAHDFNNLLTIILGNAGIARMIAGPDGGIARPIGEIESACGRAAHLCSQIGAYAGVGRMLATEVALDALLCGSEAALQVAAGRHAVLKWSLGAESGAVQGEARQIRQAVLNAVANAGEASGERGGEIGIATDRLTVADSPEGFSPPIPPGEYLRIRIADSGDGMPEAVRARAFEAFYSTKFTGRGLGLAAVHGIVRDHGGASGSGAGPESGRRWSCSSPHSGSLRTARE